MAIEINIPKPIAEWGEIDGTLSNQSDLQAALNLKANDADISVVGFSNDYNDLDDKPTIPSVAGATGEIQFNNGGVFGASSKLKYSNGTLIIQGSGSTNATATQIWENTNGVELMRISDGGNVGIGTDSPALQSGGTGIHISGVTSSEIKFTNNTTGKQGGNGTALVSSGNHFIINNRQPGNLSLNTNNTTRIFISAAGNVGIGTIAPKSKLDVVGLTAYADNAAAITAGLTAGAFYIRTGHGLDIVV